MNETLLRQNAAYTTAVQKLLEEVQLYDDVMVVSDKLPGHCSVSETLAFFNIHLNRHCKQIRRTLA